MSNPVINEHRITKAAEQAGWAAPSATTRAESLSSTTHMTVGGTVSASAVLLTLLLVAAVIGWTGVTATDQEVQSFPTYAIVSVVAGFALAILLAFKPVWARVLAPVYAVAQGLFVGAISRVYETYYDGIIVQAAGATIAVFAVMLALHGLRIIRVTDRFRRTVIGATLGIMLFYGVSLLMALFGATPPFIASTSVFGIAFSVFVAAIAALNLALDFDFIERGAQQRMPKTLEWFAAFGLLVTIVWLYLEILRLLAKLRER